MIKPRLLIVVLTASVTAQSCVRDSKSTSGILKPAVAATRAIPGGAVGPAARTDHGYPGLANTGAIDRRYIRLRADARSAPMKDAPRLAMGSSYAGPADTTSPSGLAICDPAVHRALDAAWSSSFLASHRPPMSESNKIEYGFAIEADPATRLLAIGSMATSDLTGNKPNELRIRVDAHTIATVHTHNLGARPTPSAADAAGDLPAFVKSQFHLYVTIPGTGTYAEVDLQKVCNAGQ